MTNWATNHLFKIIWISTIIWAWGTRVVAEYDTAFLFLKSNFEILIFRFFSSCLSKLCDIILLKFVVRNLQFKQLNSSNLHLNKQINALNNKYLFPRNVQNLFIQKKWVQIECVNSQVTFRITSKKRTVDIIYTLNWNVFLYCYIVTNYQLS